MLMIGSRGAREPATWEEAGESLQSINHSHDRADGAWPREELCNGRFGHD